MIPRPSEQSQRKGAYQIGRCVRPAAADAFADCYARLIVVPLHLLLDDHIWYAFVVIIVIEFVVICTFVVEAGHNGPSV